MREYEIKGLSAAQMILVTRSLQIMNHLVEDEEELVLVAEILEKIRKSASAD